MAAIVRYFSTVSAGSGDGIDWDNRAALFDGSGNWSTIITGWNFGVDSLVCRVGPGTYSCTQELGTGIFTVAPNAFRHLWLVAADSSGNELSHPNPNWVSSMPAWNDSLMPVISTASNINIINLTHVGAYLIKFTATGRTGGGVLGACRALSCIVENSASGVSVRAAAATAVDCVLRVSGTSYQAIGNGVNCRLEGNSSATSGERNGLHYYSGFYCTILNTPGNGAIVGGFSEYNNCLFINTGSGIRVNGSSASIRANGSIFVGIATYAVVGTNGGGVLERCRARNCTSGVAEDSDVILVDTITSTGTDTDEFVDAANGDYRIKYGSILWGKGIGAGDGPATIAY